jgi:5-methylcytosine-specific restriction endonuclease McrA
MNNVTVLNADYNYLNNISWQKAIVLIFKGKAEIIKATNTIISNVDKSVQYFVPKVIKLINYVNQIYKNKIPYSKFNIFIRDNYTCQYCGVKLTKNECTIDHVKPKVKGGKSSWYNCVCACRRCNNFKADRDISDTPFQFKKLPTRPSIADFIRLKSKKNKGV